MWSTLPWQTFATVAAGVLLTGCAATGGPQPDLIAAPAPASTSPSDLGKDAPSLETTATPSPPTSPSPSPVPELAPPDPAAGLHGDRRFRGVLPTVNEMADTVGGLWGILPSTYQPPGMVAADEDRLDRALTLLAEPARCRRAAHAMITGRTWEPSDESAHQTATQPTMGSLGVAVRKYRSVAAAAAELARWRMGFNRCRRYGLTTSPGESLEPLRVQSLRNDPNGMIARIYVQSKGQAPPTGVYKTFVLRQHGSALIMVDELAVYRSDGVWVERAAPVPDLIALAATVQDRIDKLDPDRRQGSGST